MPVALNCCCTPSGIDGIAGVTTIDTSVACVTVNPVVLVIEPEAAVMLVVPCSTLVTSPWLPTAVLMVAAAVFDEPHVTTLVRFCVEPSL